MSDSPSPDSLIGAQLGPYQVESVAGRGGMGVVYLAEDPRLHRRVALKVIAPGLAQNQAFRERFLRETRIAASLEHPNIVPIHDAGVSDGVLYLAMRYVEGADLRELLQTDGPLEAARALTLIGQVASALDAAHTCGLVHRDVKPENILIAEGDHVYLTDFGISEQVGPLESSGEKQFTGTVDYVAPEQIGAGPVDGRADVYSLGCVLFECLAGEPPFKRESPLAVLWAHLDDDPPSPTERRPELSAEIDSVLARALAKEPDERFSTCSELVEAAREALGLEAARFSRRAILLTGGGLVVGLAAAAAVPAILLNRSGEKKTAAPGILPLKTDSVVKIEPTTDSVVKAVPTGSASGPLVYGEGSLWLLRPDQQVVSQINPIAGSVVAEINIEEARTPRLLAVDEAALWISSEADLLGPRLWKYDLTTHELAGIDLGLVFPDVLAVADGALWVGCCDDLLRIDPATGEITASIKPITGGNLIATGPGALWLAGDQDDNPIASPGTGGRIWRINPETNTIVATIDVDSLTTDMATEQDAVWLLSAENDRVSRIDTTTNKVTDAFRVGRNPDALTGGEGAVWVTSSRDGTVTRLDVRTADLKTIDIGGTATDIVAGANAVWVSVTV